MIEASRNSSRRERSRFIRRTGVPLQIALGFAVYLVSSIVASSTASAMTTHSAFAVSVIVMPRTAILAASMPDALEVSARDVERGFVEVTRESPIVVTNNSPGGFELDVWPVGSIFSAVTVYGIGADVSIGADGGSIFLRGRHGAAIPMRLNFRFRLPPGTLPGRYPWPLQFGIQPIIGSGA